MIAPCPKCGATKTDPVPHDFKYNLARALGYHLQKCSRCRAARFLPRHSKKTHGSSPSGNHSRSGPRPGEEPGSLVRPAVGPALDGRPVAGADGDTVRCPGCGSERFHRTQRTLQERMLGRAPMARCETCGLRFPHPRYAESDVEPAKPAEATPAASQFAEERQVPEMTKENTRSESPREAAHAKPSNDVVPECPSCGSSKYHRTERTTLERALRRPAMARCEKCGKRFPYVRHPDEPKASSTAGKKTRPDAGVRADSAGSSDQGSGRCPFCGSATYRRSRRTAAERLLFRPKMARCGHCRKRFPLPAS